MRHFEPLNHRYRAIVEVVADLGVVDRYALYALFQRPGFQPDAIKNAIRKLKKADYLIGPIWYPSDRVMAKGAGSASEVLSLGSKGRQELGISERRRLTSAKEVARMRSNRSRIPHELGISAFHALIIRGRIEGLWEEEWTQPTTVTYPQGDRERRFYPDALFSLSASGRRFQYGLEYERGNRVFGNADHTTATEKFKNYRTAIDHGSWRGWVLFLADTKRHKERLRQHCVDTLGASTASTFRFLSDEEYRISDPKALLSPVLISSRVDNPNVALIPS